jgi:regulator of replication initiation timing
MASSREAELLQKLQQSLEENARLKQENTLLRQKIDLLVRRIFGASSEKLDAAQLELLLKEEAERGKAPASSALLEEAAPPS